jgi:hypothetical protein
VVIVLDYRVDIEESNEQLTNELAKEKEAHLKTQEELEISKHIIAELEKKGSSQPVLVTLFVVTF